MGKNISIKEIALLSGVSIATVSRVVNQKGGYSPQTEQIVKEMIEKCGYTPNLVAKGLRTNKNPVIGILVPDIANEYFSRLILELQNVFFANGYLTMVCNSNESRELEEQYLKAMAGQNVSGIVLVSGTEAGLRPKGIPAVYVGRKPRGMRKLDGNIVFVESDNVTGGYLAARELIDKGSRHIMFITDVLKGSSKLERYQGYCNALLEAGIELNLSLVLKVDKVSAEDGYRAIEKALDKGMQMDGVMCVTDMLAIGAVMALQERGIRVPEDVKVTGFDDISSSRYFRVPLTTVHQYTDKMAEVVSKELLQLIEKQEVPVKEQVIPVSLIKRESTQGRKE